MALSKQELYSKFLVFLFPTIMVYRLFVAMGYNLYLIWLIYFFTIFYSVYSYHHTIKSGIKTITKYWLYYLLLSSFLYLFSNVPFECFVSEIYVFILPVLFVFIGSYDNNDDFYKWYVYATVFCLIIGFFLFLTQPSWYVNFLLNARNDAWYADEVYTSVLDVKFSSFFPSSYAISFFATFSSCIIICDIFKTQNDRLINNRLQQFSLLAICYVAALLCRHRVAIIFPPLVISYFIFTGVLRADKRSIFSLLFIALFVWLILLFSKTVSNTPLGFVIDDIQHRFTEMSYDQAMEGSRTNQIQDVWDSWNNIVIGEGLGSRNGNARKNQLVGITDGNFVKLLVENGVIGIGWFLFIVFRSLIHANKKRKLYYTEIWIILYMLFAMTGSNGLCIEYYYSIIFWYALGRVWNTKKVKYE